MAECAVCSAHIGWAFSVDKTATATDWSAAAATATKGAANATRDSDDGVITGSEEGIAFLGLVLTHLRERACTHAELDASTARAARPKTRATLLERLREYLLGPEELAELEAAATEQLELRQRQGSEGGEESAEEGGLDDDEGGVDGAEAAEPTDSGAGGGERFAAADEAEPEDPDVHDSQSGEALGAVDGLPSG